MDDMVCVSDRVKRGIMSWESLAARLPHGKTFATLRLPEKLNFEEFPSVKKKKSHRTLDHTLYFNQNNIMVSCHK